MCGCLSHAPYWRPGPQPKQVPWLGVKPVTLWFPGPHSIHWVTPARRYVFWYHCGYIMWFCVKLHKSRPCIFVFLEKGKKMTSLLYSHLIQLYGVWFWKIEILNKIFAFWGHRNSTYGDAPHLSKLSSILHKLLKGCRTPSPPGSSSCLSENSWLALSGCSNGVNAFKHLEGLSPQLSTAG